MVAKKNPSKKPPADKGRSSDSRQSPEGKKPSPSDIAKGQEMKKGRPRTDARGYTQFGATKSTVQYVEPYKPMFPKGTPFKERVNQPKKSAPGVPGAKPNKPSMPKVAPKDGGKKSPAGFGQANVKPNGSSDGVNKKKKKK